MIVSYRHCALRIYGGVQCDHLIISILPACYLQGFCLAVALRNRIAIVIPALQAVINLPLPMCLLMLFDLAGLISLNLEA
jgi:hypothetical protein